MNHYGWLDTISSFDEHNVISEYLAAKYQTGGIYPKKDEIFKAFKFFKPEETKVVVIGDRPYNTHMTANGLAFGVENGKYPPKELSNIISELKVMNCLTINNKDKELDGWANQGVLLLNRALTSEFGCKETAIEKSWLKMTNEIISKVSQMNDFLVFILLCENSDDVTRLIDRRKHLILQSDPKDYDTLVGSHIFLKADEFLSKNGRKIDWSRISDKKDSYSYNKINDLFKLTY